MGRVRPQEGEGQNEWAVAERPFLLTVNQPFVARCAPILLDERSFPYQSSEVRERGLKRRSSLKAWLSDGHVPLAKSLARFFEAVQQLGDKLPYTGQIPKQEYQVSIAYYKLSDL